MTQDNTFQRRKTIKALGLGLGGVAFGMPAFSAPRVVKIGIAAPRTGHMAAFAEPQNFVVAQFNKQLGGKIRINGMDHPLVFVIKDTQSNPNRSAEVTLDLIQKDKVDIVLCYGGPENANPASDQCELNGVPCIASDLPLEPWFFGRGGKPNKGFDWTFCAFFGAADYSASMLTLWSKVPNNKVIGGLWPNDADGLALSKQFTADFSKQDYRVVDPGRFDLPASNFSAQIAAFKAAGAEIVQCILPPPDFTLFWAQCAQQGFKPKLVVAGKSTEYPASINPLGDKAVGLAVPIWWTPTFPFTSSITEQSASELTKVYEAASNRQWTAGLGTRHAMLEVAVDALRRTHNIDDPAAVRDALRTTRLQTVVGPIDFRTGPYPNTSLLPLVMGQWEKSSGGYRFPYNMVVVDNSQMPKVPLSRPPKMISYG